MFQGYRGAHASRRRHVDRYVSRVVAVAALLLAVVLNGCADPTRSASGRPALDEPAPAARAPAAASVRGTDAQRGPERGGPLTGMSQAGGPRAPEFYTGTGSFVHNRVERLDTGDGGEGFTLNFVDATVAEAVDAVLGDILDLNYAIDPAVTGNITARTARPLSRAQILPALEDILALNGAALVRSGDIYRIVPLQQAGSAAPVLSTAGRTDAGYAIHVIPLEHAAAEAIHETLQAFIAPGRTLQVDAGRNLLLFRGPGTEARDLVEIVRLFDVDWMAGMSFALIPLSSADAADVADELAAVFGQTDGEGPTRGLVRFLPIARMNAVLVISERPGYLRRAETWIERLDRGIAEGQRQLFVYHVRNARAADLADVLGEIYDTRTAGDVSLRGGEVAPGTQAARVSETTRSFGGGNGIVSGLSGLGRGLDGAGPGPSADASADDPSGAISGGSSPAQRRRPDARGTAGTGGDGQEGGNAAVAPGPRIVADVRNNALLVLATGQEYRMIEQTLKRLDLVPLQVLIEATIAEVRLNDELSYGVRWFFENQSGSVGQQVQFSELSNGVVGPSFPGFSYLLELSDGRVALNALNAVTQVNVISSPQLMVLDNGSARLQVGDQVPVPVQQSVSVTGSDAPLINTIQYVDTGVILEVAPNVNASGLVVLDVRQEVSDVVSTVTSGLDAPTIQQRVIESAIAVQNGETIALGGLIRDNKEEGMSGVPVLMDIPLLGNLFKANDDVSQRTELLILLTPRVVRNQEEAREVTRELRRRLKGLDYRRQRDTGAPETAAPLPPEPSS